MRALVKFAFFSFLLLSPEGIIFAYTPSIQSLLRNGNNRDVSSNFIELKFKIEEFDLAKDEGNLDEESESMLLNKNSQEHDKGKEGNIYYLKMTFIQEEYEKVHLILKLYRDGTMSEKSLIFHEGRNNWLKRLKSKRETDLDHDIFYSALSSIVFNNEGPFINFLAKNEDEFLPNTEILNVKKMKVLENQLNSMEKLSSPSQVIAQRNPSSKYEMKKILKENTFLNTGKVFLDKDNENIHLKIMLSKFSAKFSNEHHRMMNIMYTSDDETMQLDFYDYSLLNGLHEMPRNWVVRTTKSKIFSFQVLELVHSNLSSNGLKSLTEEEKKNMNRRDLLQINPIHFL